MPLDALWAEAMTLLAERGFVVESLDEEAGRITAYGSSVESDAKTAWLDCGRTASSVYLWGGGERAERDEYLPVLTVELSPVSEARSRVHLNLVAHYVGERLGRMGLGGARWSVGPDEQKPIISCLSHQVLEGELVAALDSLVSSQGGIRKMQPPHEPQTLDTGI